MQPLPNQNSSLTDQSGGINKPWSKYLQQFTQAPPPFIPKPVFPYTAVEPGYIFIDGGVSKVTLTRGTITIDCTGALFIPISINDTVAIVGNATVAYFIAYGLKTILS